MDCPLVSAARPSLNLSYNATRLCLHKHSQHQHLPNAPRTRQSRPHKHNQYCVPNAPLTTRPSPDRLHNANRIRLHEHGRHHYVPSAPLAARLSSDQFYNSNSLPRARLTAPCQRRSPVDLASANSADINTFAAAPSTAEDLTDEAEFVLTQFEFFEDSDGKLNPGKYGSQPTNTTTFRMRYQLSRTSLRRRTLFFSTVRALQKL